MHDEFDCLKKLSRFVKTLFRHHFYTCARSDIFHLKVKVWGKSSFAQSNLIYFNAKTMSVRGVLETDQGHCSGSKRQLAAADLCEITVLPFEVACR